MRRFAILVLLCPFVGCDTAPFDSSMICHREFTNSGVDFKVCAVNSGNSFIETDYGDIDCASWHGIQDCGRTAELYIGAVDACMQDAADRIVGISDL